MIMIKYHLFRINSNPLLISAQKQLLLVQEVKKKKKEMFKEVITNFYIAELWAISLIYSLPPYFFLEIYVKKGCNCRGDEHTASGDCWKRRSRAKHIFLWRWWYKAARGLISRNITEYREMSSISVTCFWI